MNRNVKKQLSDDNALTVRPPSTAILGINSQDREIRVGNYSPSSFDLTQGTAYMNGQFTRVALSEVRFDYITPPLSGFAPLQFTYKTGGTLPPVSVLLISTANSYTWANCSTLASIIQAEVRALTPMTGFTMTFNDTFNSGAYIFRAESNTTDTFYFSPAPFTTGTPPNVTTYPIDLTNIYFRMNFENDYKTQPFATEQDTGVPCLLLTRFVDIVCEQLTNSQNVRDSSTQQTSDGQQRVSHDTICRLYLKDPNLPYYDQGSEPFTVVKQFKTPKEIKWNPGVPIANMSFRVLDDQGQILKYINPRSPVERYLTGNWCITLLVTEN